MSISTKLTDDEDSRLKRSFTVCFYIAPLLPVQSTGMRSMLNASGSPSLDRFLMPLELLECGEEREDFPFPSVSGVSDELDKTSAAAEIGFKCQERPDPLQSTVEVDGTKGWPLEVARGIQSKQLQTALLISAL